jgi:PAP2 superfamily
MVAFFMPSILIKNLNPYLLINKIVRMKITYQKTALMALIAVFIFTGCSKDINDRTAQLLPLQPASADTGAGNWKPILLVSPAEFAVAAPIATNSPDYIIQINEIKATQAELSEEERSIVKYWAAGGVLRWNEILRELVAKHNLPPYQNADGTYPFPSAANPLAYPLFPFANPPYAARAYAYVSAAQYDALVAAWYYKNLYKRKAPYKVDSSLNLMVPSSDLPSYPSEDAVIAGAAVEMMKLLFPGDQDFILQKAAEHKMSRIIAGANVRSDLDAGEALGKAVALKFVARARGDRAGAAAGNQAVWTKLEEDCKARGEIPWSSYEIPKRPPMLPLYGKVKSFTIDSLGLLALRPSAPPSTSSEQMKNELAEVYEKTKNLSRDEIKLVHFWADGAATYTPPGHWNAIAADDFIKENFSEVRWARNLALLNLTMMDAAIVCWDTKYFYFSPRPTQLDGRIKTITGLPNFPSYISGHSTFSAAASTVLGHILPSHAAAYTQLANDASKSRVYGGIHYPSDCSVGLTVGKNVGAIMVQRAQADGAE